MSTLAEAATEKDVYLSEFNRLEKELSRRGRPGVQRLRLRGHRPLRRTRLSHACAMRTGNSPASRR